MPSTIAAVSVSAGSSVSPSNVIAMRRWRSVARANAAAMSRRPAGSRIGGIADTQRHDRRAVGTRHQEAGAEGAIEPGRGEGPPVDADPRRHASLARDRDADRGRARRDQRVSGDRDLREPLDRRRRVEAGIDKGGEGHSSHLVRPAGKQVVAGGGRPGMRIRDADFGRVRVCARSRAPMLRVRPRQEEDPAW